MIKEKIAVIGGDLRILEAAKALAIKGYSVFVYGIDVREGSLGSANEAKSLEEALKNAGLVILPIPYSRDDGILNAPLSTHPIKLSELWELADDGVAIAAGMADGIPSKFRVFDYLKDEEFALRNAAASVEGAIAVAIRETDFTLLSSKCLVLGYGRIGKLLSGHLRDLGADVTVFARSPLDRVRSEISSIRALDYSSLAREAETADIIFNTVPTTLVTRSVLEGANREMVIIDLSSSPGGVDRHAADSFGIKTVTALGLPGKFSPKSAGKIIASCAESLIL